MTKIIAICLGGLLLLGCSADDISSGEDADTGLDTDSLPPPVVYSKVDLLVMMDNSNSMLLEQATFAAGVNSFFDAISSTWPASDLRVALITSDLGMSWGGNPYQVGDGWPEGMPPSPCNTPMGNEGVFQNVWIDGTDTFGDDVTALGITGCGLGQQLQSSALALHREDQSSFIRDDALLVILMVTDEEDCSIESAELFASEYVQNPNFWGIFCEQNTQHLYTAAHFAESYRSMKGGLSRSVLFAAITGVPVSPNCQNTGDELASCLDMEEMQHPTKEQVDSYWFPLFACVRNGAGDDYEPITEAVPGRRFVEMAQQHGDMGYIYSICNEDWSPAFDDIAD